MGHPAAASVSEPEPQVLCFGEALVDRLGPPGGDPAAGQDVDDRLGGAPANVACALARLGTTAAFLGRLGRDRIGQAFAELFATRRLNTRGVQWDERRPSRVVLVRRDRTGERQFQGFCGAADGGFADQAIDPEPLATFPLHGVRWLLMGTIPLASPPAAMALQTLCDRAAAADVALALDVNWRPTFWDPAADPAAGPTAAQKQIIHALLRRARLIKCANEEALWLFGHSDPRLIRDALPLRPAVVVTDGAQPLRWCLGDQEGDMEVFPVVAVDTTGAGDAFTAGLLHGLITWPHMLTSGSPQELRQLMQFAAACGALVCQGPGAIDPQPDRTTVHSFLTAQGLEPLASASP